MITLEDRIKITLKNGEEVFVSKEDEVLNSTTWFLIKNGKRPNCLGYAACSYGYGSTQLMHRIVAKRMGLDISDITMVVDHKDCNPFNNCRSNLRLTTQSINSSNRRDSHEMTNIRPFAKGFYVEIRRHKKRFYKYFKDVNQAKLWRDSKIQELEAVLKLIEREKQV